MLKKMDLLMDADIQQDLSKHYGLMENNTITKPLILRPMKRYKVTYNYFESGKKRIAIRILEAIDKEHAMQLMAMWPRLILKIETL